MDRSEVVRCAIQGAAKVAFSAALVACGGVTIEDSALPSAGGAGGQASSVTTALSVASSDVVTVAASSTVTSASTASTTAGGGGLCNVGLGAPFDAETIACCNQMVETAFPGDEPILSPRPAAGADLTACCGVALEARDHPNVGDPVPVPWSAGYSCCGIPGVEQPKPYSPTCSPWGPPAPPAMPSDLVWIEEVA